MYEEYTAEFQRITYLYNANGDSDEDLDKYSIGVTYRLVDCAKDFDSPAVFIEPVPVDEFRESAVNYLDEGRHYFTQYEVNRPKIFSFTLVIPNQKYADVCGQV